MSKQLTGYWVDRFNPTSLSQRVFVFWDTGNEERAMWMHCHHDIHVPDYAFDQFRFLVETHGWELNIVEGYKCDAERCTFTTIDCPPDKKCTAFLCRGHLIPGTTEDPQ